jgi:hypothetical protein
VVLVTILDSEYGYRLQLGPAIEANHPRIAYPKSYRCANQTGEVSKERNRAHIHKCTIVTASMQCIVYPGSS